MKKSYFFIALFLLTLVKAFAQPAGWSYVLPYAITENSGTLVTAYQARLDINTQALISAGQMQASGADIRFGKDCAGNTLYNYWIESGINTSNTIIWVKIDTLQPLSTSSFFLFYGNSSAAAVSAIPGTFDGPMSSTDSVSSGGAGGVTNSQRGFRFSPNEDILVTAFGKMEPTGTDRTVTLFDFASQAVILQDTVTGPAGQYSYDNLSNPIWLTQGTQYLLELYQGSSDGYYFGTSSQIGQHLTYFDMRYCNGCAANTFPTNTLTGYHYGYPDLWYWLKNNVSPAPTISTGAALTSHAGADVVFCAGSSGMIGALATGGSLNTYTYSWAPTAGLSATNTAVVTASPASTTTYTLTVTDACGTIASDSVVVTVNPLPVLNAARSVSLICGSGSSTLSAANAVSYNWMPGNLSGASVTVTPASTTTYTVTGTDVNGCVNTDSANVQLVPLPVVTVTGNYSITCDNAVMPLTLHASGASTYNWMPVSGIDSTLTDTPTVSTTYMVIGTDSNGCVDTAAYAVTLLSSPVATLALSSPAVCEGQCDTIFSNVVGGSSPYSYTWTPVNAVGSYFVSCTSTSTCYTLTIVDVNGCTTTSSTCVTVNPAPVISSSSIAVICAGDSASLSIGGSNIATANWSPSSGLSTTSGTAVNASPAASIIYTVIAASASGCTDTASVSVTVNPLPNVSFVSPLDSLCVTDGAATLSGGTPAGGTYSGTGVSGGSFTPSVAGNGTHVITYSYTDANTCSASATQTIVVDACTGIKEAVVSTNGISVYPNPFSSVITIERTSGAEVTLNLFDAQGKLVFSKQTNGTRIEIDTNGIANGIYSLQVLDSKSVNTFKVVKNN